ncbi:OmpA family protein [Desulfopila inferna]|uniref:OmpA family protein n=1 Tax=Desulfopila inferna TaxID=468528 RepID=UPI001965B940|nr:OmpA family protein [Desulfopila inferna]MBM9603932.1 OmpA family protein [Desulfopila inferna]
MKIMKAKDIILTALLGSALLLGGGCAKKAVDAPGVNADGTPMTGGTDIDYPAAEGSPYSETSLGAEGTLDDTGIPVGNGARGNLSLNDEGGEKSREYKLEHGRSSVGLSPVYFSFDQAGIRPDMIDRMENNALFLKQTPDSNVVIEGNSDERGTKEYNLALGQRRAQNALEYLVNLGVENTRMRAISYGEEHPLFPEQDEFSYAQNRRVDFILE